MRWRDNHLLALCALITTLGASATAAAQPFHMEDSLRDGTTGNASGGSFGPEGWTVTRFDDAIWWALPTLQSGYVEFTVANITLDVLPLGDHEIFAMYEAGYGIGEPINYSPEFRQNHYKVLMRIYGTPEPSRAGSMKLMWGMCPDGAPGWYTAGCICPEGTFDEPFADPGAWTGAPVRMRVEWGGGHSRLLRDGVEVVSIDWSGSGLTFGPEALHMMLGSPRNDGGLSAMPMGARFSDLVVDGEMGAVETCGTTTPPDAGVLLDAGACTMDGIATADGTAASWLSGVYPDASDLNVEGDGAAPSAVVYMRFPEITGAVSSATLHMSVATTPSAGGGSGQICRVDGGTWDESTLTWSTRPTVSSACSGGARTVSAGEAISWDVTSLITGAGTPTFALVSTDGDGAHFVSREAGGCTLAPRLDVTIAPGVDGGPRPDTGVPTDASSSGIDSGSSGFDSGSARDAGRAGGGISAGCGCRAASSHGSSAVGLALFALVLGALRRRRATSARR